MLLYNLAIYHRNLTSLFPRVEFATLVNESLVTAQPMGKAARHIHNRPHCWVEMSRSADDNASVFMAIGRADDEWLVDCFHTTNITQRYGELKDFQQLNAPLLNIRVGTNWRWFPICLRFVGHKLIVDKSQDDKSHGNYQSFLPP